MLVSLTTHGPVLSTNFISHLTIHRFHITYANFRVTTLANVHKRYAANPKTRVCLVANNHMFATLLSLWQGCGTRSAPGKYHDIQNHHLNNEKDRGRVVPLSSTYMLSPISQAAQSRMHRRSTSRLSTLTHWKQNRHQNRDMQGVLPPWIAFVFTPSSHSRVLNPM